MQKLIIDVRSEMEYAGGAYPGAVNIPVNELGNRIDEIGNKNREIIVYCASGGRSSMAASLLMSLGYKNVSNGGGLMDMMA